jgi:hypothetical protein
MMTDITIEVVIILAVLITMMLVIPTVVWFSLTKFQKEQLDLEKEMPKLSLVDTAREAVDEERKYRNENN